ncbi:wall-associated receptor kinase 2-like isoform X1 [Panicum virgatum]|uniref:wall-associated receptor kinase 2-like isoform X1 n=1 Tax=Panicum virgatum TaxID=38727 RepID=UPI0019D5017D|nr:wall-associated receptor kinase 2-like isoform X1 [Panicum virgatum]XP_039824829.1 wall-associated receptor kinase 2-like isoform X1 [Panicum virgatum]
MMGTDGVDEAPILLAWSVARGLPPQPQRCDDDTRRRLCKSQNSRCLADLGGAGFMCQCQDGYDGNPYLPGGCQDIDECKLPSEDIGCFGECVNTVGSYYCLCPHRSYGNPDAQGGCVNISSTTTDEELLPTVAPAPIGLPNCSTTCGDVSVPYPFGIGAAAGCSWPGFHLTCNTSYNPPRLFIDSNATLEVVDIFLADSTLRVIYETTVVSLGSSDGGNGHMVGTYNLPDIGGPYMLSDSNEFILYGCDAQATLYGEYINGSSSTTSNDSVISRCVSTCSSDQVAVAAENSGSGLPVPMLTDGTSRSYCSGNDGCCHAPISAGSAPRGLDFKGLNTSQKNPVCMFVSEEGLTDQWQAIFNISDLGMRFYSVEASPLVLRWVVKEGFSVPASASNSGQCPGDVAKRLCRSEHSNCKQEYGGFTCYCYQGYQGNPYIANGCQGQYSCPIYYKTEVS